MRPVKSYALTDINPLPPADSGSCPSTARHHNELFSAPNSSRSHTPRDVGLLQPMSTPSSPGPYHNKTKSRAGKLFDRTESLRDTKILAQNTGLKRSESIIQPDLFHYQDHFQFIGLAGKTATSEVFKVKHKTTGELFAIKRSRRRFRSKLQRQRCLREIRSVIALPLHPHIVGQHRAWQEGGHFYIQMDFCPNGSLQQLLKRTSCSSSSSSSSSSSPPLTDQAIWSIAWEVANGLLFLHTNGVMHLDIKPDNIYFDAQGKCKIGDFGLAVVGTDMTDWEEGDGDYLAPELLGPRAEPSPKADIFSLGATLYECATGRKIDRTLAIDTYLDTTTTAAAPSPSPLLLPGRPEAMNKLVSLMLAGDAAARPSAEEVLQFMRDNGVAGQEVKVPSPQHASANGNDGMQHQQQQEEVFVLPEQQLQQQPIIQPAILMSPASGFSSLRLDCHHTGSDIDIKQGGAKTEEAVIIREVNNNNIKKPALSPFQQADLNLSPSPSLFVAAAEDDTISPIIMMAAAGIPAVGVPGSLCDDDHPSPLAAEFSFAVTKVVAKEDKENSSTRKETKKNNVYVHTAITIQDAAAAKHGMKWVPSLSPLISEPDSTPGGGIGGENTTPIGTGEAATPLLVVHTLAQQAEGEDKTKGAAMTRKHRRDSPTNEYEEEDDDDVEEGEEEDDDDDDEIVYDALETARDVSYLGGGSSGGKMRRPPVPLLPPITVPPPTSGRRSATATAAAAAGGGVSGGRLHQQQPLSALHSCRTQQDSFRLHKRDLLFSPDGGDYDFAMTETESLSESEPYGYSCGSGRTMSFSDMDFADAVSPAIGTVVVGRLPLGMNFAAAGNNNNNTAAAVLTTPINNQGAPPLPSFLNAPAPTPESSYNSEEGGEGKLRREGTGRSGLSSSSSPDDLAKSLSAKSYPRSFVVPPHALQWELHMSPELNNNMLQHLPPGSPKSPSVIGCDDNNATDGGGGGDASRQATSRSTSMRRFPTLDSLSTGGVMMMSNGGSGVVGVVSQKHDSSSSLHKELLDVLLSGRGVVGGGNNGMPPVPPLVLNVDGGQGSYGNSNAAVPTSNNKNMRRKRQLSSRRALALSTENSSGQLASSRSMDGLMPLTSKARHHSARGDLKTMAAAAAAAVAAVGEGGVGIDGDVLETARGR